MHKLLQACTALACLLPFSNWAQPNVVLIVVDDLGWADVGYNSHGNPFETPNIDRMATDGLVFTDSYAGAANCAPSRAVMISGQFTPRHGIYTVSPSGRGHEKTRKLIPTANVDILADEVITMAEMFKSKGYATGSFGKWHLGDDARTQGFDRNVAGHMKGHPKTYFSPYNLPFLEDGPKGEYLPNRITTEAIQWIESVKDQPFFAYIPYYTVHTPLQAVESVKQKYLNKPGIKDEKQATYAAMVELMDNNVGRILHSLKQNKLSDNTLVVFTSDNGGIRSIAYQDPLRAGKGSYYEGGLRVPLIMKWTGKIKPGLESTPVVNADFYPTFMNLIGAPTPNQVLDGVDLSNLVLSGQPLDERAIYWHFPIYLQAYNPRADQSQDPLFRTRPGSAMRKGKWKLIHYFENDEYELYDLENDLGEHNNFAAHYPELLNELKEELHSWRESVAAPIPSETNPAYNAKFEAKLTQKKLIQKSRN